MKQQEYKNFNLTVFFELLNPFKRQFCILLFTGLSWAVFTVLRSYSIKLIIDQLVQTGTANLAIPIFMYYISWLGSEGFTRIRDYIVMYLKPYLKKHIIMVVSRRMHKYDDHYFQRNHPGSLINGIKNLYDGIDDGIYILEELFSHFILVISTLISLYILNFYFSIVILCWIIIWGAWAHYWAKKGYILAYTIHESRTKMTFHLADLFTNITITKLFNATEHENKLTEKVVQEAAEIEYKREKMFLQIWIVQGLLFFLVMSIIFYILITQYQINKVTIGDFGMLIELLTIIYLYMFDLAKDLSEFSETVGKISQGLNLLHQKIEKETKSTMQKLIISKGEIVLKKICYQYPDGEEPALVSQKIITIKGGSTVALVGPSGSGKSTIIKLLLRLIDPLSGQILIDGQDISLCNIDSVRKIFAYVPQDIGLFHRSISENIKYGSFDKTNEEMITAAKKTEIHDTILGLPNNYDTIYGSEINLSGGQKQRIMIARGLIRDAKIFIFDESTSSLDLRTERHVLDNIRKKTKGCTKIVIAHRLDTVKTSDLILVCNDGEIVEYGNHDELLKNNGLYSSLININSIVD